jgi:hypothetical protein
MVVATALLSSGCLAVAAGTAAVAGGTAGYVYYKGSIPQDFRASFPDAWNATLAALRDLGMPLVHNEAGAESGSIESRNADNETVSISLETQTSKVPVEEKITRVSVRVGVWGDRQFSERLLAQIGTHLPSAMPPPPPPPPPVGMSTREPPLVPVPQTPQSPPTPGVPGKSP